MRKGHNVKGGGTPGDVEGRGRQEMVIKWKAGGDDRSLATWHLQPRALRSNHLRLHSGSTVTISFGCPELSISDLLGLNENQLSGHRENRKEL